MNNENNNNTTQHTFPDPVVVGGNTTTRMITFTGSSYDTPDFFKVLSRLVIGDVNTFVGDINYDPTYYMRDHDQSHEIPLSGNIPNPA